MRFLFVALTVLFSTSALAEEQLQVGTASVQQAMGQKLLEEINANLALRAKVIELQAQIKELQDKAKPPETSSSSSGSSR